MSYTVTQRTNSYKQPNGGFLNPKEFMKLYFNDGYILENENIHPSFVGLVVDYLSRFMLGDSKFDAFEISFKGAKIANKLELFYKLLNNVDGLDDMSIYFACKLVYFDHFYRSFEKYTISFDDINPSLNTINNIRIMVNRTVNFFTKYGPVIKTNFRFDGGYTYLIINGDGDYLTYDTLWDLKVSKYNITSKHTLQLLVYFLMGKHSIYHEFDYIKNIGVFNPRLNCAYIKRISDIDKDILDEVAYNVIGYDGTHDDMNVLINKRNVMINQLRNKYSEDNFDNEKFTNYYSFKLIILYIFLILFLIGVVHSFIWYFISEFII